MTTHKAPLLEIDALTIDVMTAHGPRRAVDGVSLVLHGGDTLGIVGESGSGKSLTLRAIMGLLPKGVIQTSGRIVLRGVDVATMTRRQRRAVCGKDIAMVFQDPMSSLNPVMRVGPQIVDGLTARRHLSYRDRRTRAIELMSRMGIPDPDRRFHAFPHQLSGGIRQRVMIASAMACEAALMLCDEPTTALDVTIQDQILRLLAELCEQSGTSLLYVTHDLAVASQVCASINVMYGGQLMESGPVADVFRSPLHPYTLGLLGAMPRVEHGKRRLVPIGGAAPALGELPAGCPFAPRCILAEEACERGRIDWRDMTDGRGVRCVRPLTDAIAPVEDQR
ncbi:MAG: hypothetical protein BGO26_00885 [Actinobacteria bacterium 69-20]|jgi:peptide/nickel transport system ATP-binding protein/oligopeptide transport system ATP-binding protein|nr:ABC transporter ATP-binding protein [Actinomycetota bacterium]OJV28562.1 MAG: hypothetical protein BGO26_00885 [Actinobacteria bacterium 69-20]